MLIKANDLMGFGLQASDGSLGTVIDLMYDDASWTLRWLVVDTGGWLSERRVIIPAAALGQPDRAARTVPVDLTMAQVKDSPDVDTQRPVSRQYEASAYDHYGLDPYWGSDLYMGGFAYWGGMVPMAPVRVADRSAEEAELTLQRDDDPHLRSVSAITGYHIHATDGEIGHLSDVLIDDADWSLRYLIVNTSNWWMGQDVLISPRSARDIRWSEGAIYLTVTRDHVKGSPPYDGTRPLDATFDADMARHYGPPEA